MNKQIAFLIVLLLTACSAQPSLSDEAKLGTIVAQTLTAQPFPPTAIIATIVTKPVPGAEVIPTGDAPIVSDLTACGPANGLAYFKIDANTAFRNWEGISIDGQYVICSEVTGDGMPAGYAGTLVCELPQTRNDPSVVVFANGENVAGTFSFNEAQCTAAGFPEALTVIFTTTSAGNVNLRTNPGLLFPVSRVMAQGTRLEVHGLSPGGDWAYVLNNEGVSGWVDLTFVKPFPKAQLPVIKLHGVQEIRGSVVNADGVPLYGVNFAITQGNKRSDAKTNALGEFHAYLPTSATGVWTVGFVSFDTESNAATIQCLQDTNACGRTTPLSVEVTLPSNAPILFGWDE